MNESDGKIDLPKYHNKCDSLPSIPYFFSSFLYCVYV